MTHLTPQPITQHASPQPQTGYPVAPVTGLTAGVLATVPFPTLVAQSSGSARLTLRHCVIANASPFTLLVTQGANVTQIPAFTADDVQIFETGQTTGITLLPQATGALVNPSADTTVYATWYADDPPGIYPCAIGAGSTPLTNTFSLVNDPGRIIGSGSSQSYTVAVQPWMQAIAIRVFKQGGTANGVRVQIVRTGTPTDSYGLTNMSVDGQWLYVPVQGVPVTVTLSPTSAEATGAFTLTCDVLIQGMVGPVLDVTLEGGAGDLQQIGQATGGISIPTGGAATTLIAKPATGYALFVRGLWYRAATAPAAAQPLFVRGATSLTTYFSWLPGAVVGADRMDTPFWVVNATASGLNVPEGLQGVNNTSVNIFVGAMYDVRPYWPALL